MTVYSAMSALRPLDKSWADSKVLTMTIRLVAGSISGLRWLEGRWDLDAQTIAGDILVAATSGRHALAQLSHFQRLPQQTPGPLSADSMEVLLLEATAHQLRLAASRLKTDAAHAAGRLISAHLHGELGSSTDAAAAAKAATDRLGHDDASMTIWLPAAIGDKIDSLAAHCSLTKSDVIRNTLMLHVVGRIKYEEWTAEGSWRPKRKATQVESAAYKDGDILFSRAREQVSSVDNAASQKVSGRRSEFIREHGKSEAATRVFLPGWLKAQLELLATSAGVPVSEHSRRVLSTAI